MYVTIDPGIATGWAIWSLAGLVACGLGDPRSSKLHRVTTEGNDDTIHDVWIEEPVIYPRSPVPPNDIRKLALEAGRWAGRYDACCVEVHFVEPSVWKGQVPKDIHHARIWAQLREEERSVIDASVRKVAPSRRHNVLDAVGLGLWVRKNAGAR